MNYADTDIVIAAQKKLATSAKDFYVHGMQTYDVFFFLCLMTYQPVRVI